MNANPAPSTLPLQVATSSLGSAPSGCRPDWGGIRASTPMQVGSVAVGGCVKSVDVGYIRHVGHYLTLHPHGTGSSRVFPARAVTVVGGQSAGFPFGLVARKE